MRIKYENTHIYFVEIMLRNLRFFELTFGEKYAFKRTVMLFNFYSYNMPAYLPSLILH